MTDFDAANPRLLPSRAVKQRYGGICDMTLWRWVRSAELEFPEPVVINRRKYWRAADLDAFDARQTARNTAA